MKPIKPARRQPHICSRCGSQDARVEYRSDVLDFKGLTLEVDGLSNSVCGNCNYTWITDGQEHENLALLRAAFAMKRDELREREGLLTGEQISGILDDLHLSRTEAATLFGGGPNAFGKYVNGEVLQSFAMDRLLRVSLAFGSHAIAYLKQGRNAPLYRNAGGQFIAPAIGHGVSTSLTTSAPNGLTNMRLVVASQTTPLVVQV